MLNFRVIPWLAASVVIAGCGAAATNSGVAPHSAGTPSPSAASTTAKATANAQANFSCSAQSGGDAAASAQLTDVRVAHHQGYDRLTFEFATASIPAYSVTPSASTNFFHDASGQPVTLAGTAGLKLVVHHASGTDLTGAQTYRGSLDLHPALPAIRETAELGDFERVLTWGVGLTTPACFHVSEESGPPRIVIDVQAV